jgi:sulfite exporter TauE/SafE
MNFVARIGDSTNVMFQVISGLIQSLLINYGLRYSSSIGSAFEGALTTTSACFLTSALLLACYTISEKTYRLIRSSLFVRLSIIISEADQYRSLIRKDLA